MAGIDLNNTVGKVEEDPLLKQLEEMKEDIVRKCLGLPVAIIEAARGSAVQDPLPDLPCGGSSTSCSDASFTSLLMAIELEAEAYPLLDELTAKISTLNLEQVRRLKSKLVVLTRRVQKVKDEIEQLMDDDGDMVAGNLSTSNETGSSSVTVSATGSSSAAPMLLFLISRNSAHMWHSFCLF